MAAREFTVYRDGSRSGVLISNEQSYQDSTLCFSTNRAPKRPEILQCDIHQASISGEPWTIIVGLMEGKTIRDIWRKV